MSRADAGAGLEQLLERKSGLVHRCAPASVAQRLQELRAWQAGRLARTYADLRSDPLAADALGFFLSDLYGPQDLTRRDRDVARAWRLLRRALPPRMLELLSMAIELDVLSVELDLEMTRQLPAGPLTADTYAQAYRAVGRPEARRRQIGLVVEMGGALARAVRSPLIDLALRAAHAPAHLAGFGCLQDFLERGFKAFRQLPQPRRLLATIERRELRFLQNLLAGGANPEEDPDLGASGPR